MSRSFNHKRQNKKTANGHRRVTPIERLENRLLLSTAPTLGTNGPATISPNVPYVLSLYANEPGANTITSWSIDWGDGTSATPDVQAVAGNPSSVSHNYATAGNFTIAATATDQAGTYSVPAQLDGNFGNGGVIHGGVAADIALQPDDKILSLSHEYNVAQVLTRYNADGSLDTTFGTSGSISLDKTVGTYDAVAVQSDGKMIVAGFASDASLLVNRYLPTGLLDTSFGAGGKTKIWQGGSFVSPVLYKIVGIGFQSSGQIVLAGTGAIGFSAIRLTASGSLDTTFGTAGFSSLTNPIGTVDASAMVLQPNGKIVLAGNAAVSPSQRPAAALARFNANGTVDTSFGNNGIDVTDYGTTGNQYVALTTDSNGLLVAGGEINQAPSGQGVVARYKDDGTLDPSFNGTGYNSSSGIGARVYGLVALSQGRILATGGAAAPAIIRFNNDGTLDPSFSQLASFPGGPTSRYLYTPSLQSNGGLVAQASSTWSVDLERYTFSTGLVVGAGDIAVNITQTPSLIAPHAPGTFSSAVSDPTSTIVSYSWAVFQSGVPLSLPGGTVTNASTFTFTPPATPDVYGVQLTVTDANGKTGSSTQAFSIYPPPVAVQLSSGQLRITATTGTNLIELSSDGVNLNVITNNFTQSFTLASINQVSVFSGDGSDTLRVDGNVYKSVLFYSGLASTLIFEDPINNDVVSLQDSLGLGESPDYSVYGKGMNSVITNALKQISVIADGSGERVTASGPFTHTLLQFTANAGGDYFDASLATGSAMLVGGNGNDMLIAAQGPTTLLGGGGDDTIYAANPYPHFIDGGPGNNTLFVLGNNGNNDTIANVQNTYTLSPLVVSISTPSGPIYARTNAGLSISAVDPNNGAPLLTASQYVWSVTDPYGNSIYGDGAIIGIWEQQPGAYTVRARVTDAFGVVGDASSTVTVVPVLISATFSGPTYVVQGSSPTVAFSNVSGYATGSTLTYSYDFNNDGTFEIINGSSPSAAIPSSYLSTAGPRVVHGRITDNFGDHTDFLTTINVLYPITVTVPAVFNVSVTTPISFNIQETDSNTGATLNTTQWSFTGPTGTVTGTGLTASVTPQDSGLYLFSASVSDSLGAQGGVSQYVNVTDIAPTGVFHATPYVSLGAPGVVGFTNQQDISSYIAGLGYYYSYSFDGQSFQVNFTSAPTVTVPASYLSTVGPHIIEGLIYNKNNTATQYTATINVVAQLPATPLGTPGSYQNSGDTIAKAFDGNLNTSVDGPTSDGNWVGDDFGLPVNITQVTFAPRLWFANRMIGGMFQASTARDFSTGVTTLYTFASAPASGVLSTVPLNSSAAYQYYRYLSPPGSYGNIAELSFQGYQPIPIAPPAVPSGLRAVIAGPNTVNLYWGVSTLNQTGFVIDRATDANFTLSLTSIPLVASAVLISNGNYAYSDTNLAQGATYYYRIRATNSGGASANLVGNSVFLPGPTFVIIGTAGSYNNSGSTRDKAFDNNLTTFFDGPGPDNNWVGQDLGMLPQTIYQIGFAPRAGFEQRMAGGQFQGSNTADFSGPVATFYTISAVPAAGVITTAPVASGAYRYVRYLSPPGSYGDVAEVFFAGVKSAPGVPAALMLTQSGSTSVQIKWSDPLVDAQSFILERASDAGFTNIQATFSPSGTASQYLDTSVAAGATVYYRIRAVNSVGSSANTTVQPITLSTGPQPAPLTGAVIGTAGSYNNNGNTIAKVFDGLLNTYFDAPSGDGNWAGLDLGSPATISQIAYAPRTGSEGRMIGGLFQASDAANFASGVVNLFTISSAPAANQLTTVNITGAAAHRYVRYLSPNGSYGNVAEVQFIGLPFAPTQPPAAPTALLATPVTATTSRITWNDTAGDESGFILERAGDAGFANIQETQTLSTSIVQAGVATFIDSSLSSGTTYYYRVRATNPVGPSGNITYQSVFVPQVVLQGTVIGTPGSYGNSGNTAAKAFDNNLSSYFDAASADGNWAGLNLGGVHTVNQISFAPRSGFESRMIGGIFQASNTADFSSGVVNLYTVTAAPATGVLTAVSVTPASDQYVRYLAPSGSYGNIAEVQFIGS